MLLLLTFSSSAQEGYPTADLQNNHLKMTLYLPDVATGFYRATRFDWGGVIGSLIYRGHQYFDPWLDYHDPQIHEAITGPVEAFAPIGYEAAKPGDSFYVIGVGVLKKASDKPYHFSTTYEIVNPGLWKVRELDDRVTFFHELQDVGGFAYHYQKTVRLLPDQPAFVLEHDFENTGEKAIETTVYNHNFFVIDREPTGPNIVTSFPYPIAAEGRGFGDMIVPRDSALIFKRALQKGEHVYTGDIKRYGPTADDYDLHIENKKTGAAVHITGDRPLLKLPYWACATTACPEPYIALQVLPGESFTWSITYQFYLLDDRAR